MRGRPWRLPMREDSNMTITYHHELVQGTDEWMAARCGLITASEMKHIITPTLKIANNDKTRAHVYELLAQRLTQYVEPSYISDDMLRGWDDEIKARDLYSRTYAQATECGFITNDRFGFVIGCSPDALVGDDGMLEIKSRRQKYQIETIIENVSTETAPIDYMLQIQTHLLVSERAWCDFVSYSGGLHMCVIRVFPDPKIQTAIVEAAMAFEATIAEKRAVYDRVIQSSARLVPTERTVEQEMFA